VTEEPRKQDGEDDDGIFAPEKAGRGRPPHQPTVESRKYVKSMLGAGLKQDAVCAVLDISENTLRKHYPRELESAEFEVHALVGQSLVFNAIGGPDRNWQQANMSAAIFYAKTRMGWKEPPQDVNLKAAIAHYDPSKLTDEELKRIADAESILAAVAVSSGGGGGGAGEAGG
jgi:hypothetical protein